MFAQRAIVPARGAEERNRIPNLVMELAALADRNARCGTFRAVRRRDLNSRQS